MGHPLIDSLKTIPDPRGLQGRSYRLHHVLALVVLAKLSGADSLRAIEAWGTARRIELNERLGFAWGRTPKKSALALILSHVDGAALAQALGTADAAGVVHADGKVLRGQAQGALSILSAAGSMCLARIAYGQGSQAQALREWIESGAAAGLTITADAAHAQKKRSGQRAERAAICSPA